MSTPNFFNTDAFNSIQLTKGINRIPNNYGRLRGLGLFSEEPVSNRNIWIEEIDGTLTVLPTKPVGSPGELGSEDKRTGRSFSAWHIPHDDVVLPEEVQGVRVFGQEFGSDSVSAKVAQKLAKMRQRHGITLEALRWGALRGTILDADGSTLLNLYTAFNRSRTTIDFVLDNDATEIQGKCMDLLNHMDSYAQGETISGVHVFCSVTFFKAFISHPLVKAAYAGWEAAQNRLGGDLRSGFEFCGITWEQHIGSSSYAGASTNFITSDQALAVPLGTQETFVTHFAPADFNEAVNTFGLPVYAKQEERKFNRGWDIHTQSNPLVLVRRPELVVTLTI